ncbi:MAG: FtsX-like permease family protein [Pseudomonadota bacterium]
MEIRPILSAMWRNRTGSVLIALQIALTLAIVVNSMFLAVERSQFIGRPSGIDEKNIVTIASNGFGADYNHDATLEEDLRLLRALPGVVAATVSGHTPLSGSGSASGFRASMDEDAPNQSGNYFEFDHQADEALGVNIIEGRGFLETEIISTEHPDSERMPPQTIITKHLADALYPDLPTAVGQRLFNNLGESSEIVGVVEHMFGSWVHWENLENVIWFPVRPDSHRTRYIIRTQPGQRDRVLNEIEPLLADANRTRIVRNARTLEEIAGRSYEQDRAMATVLSVAIVLLLTITGLGIVGLASFTVRQRTKQIGTRRAIGARKRDIVRYFLTENWLMTTLGLILGTVLTYVVNYQLSEMFETARLDVWYLLGGMAALWLLGFLAVAGPARRAAQVSPAIATRNV